MRNVQLCGAGLAAICALGGPAAAQTSTSATAPADANVITAISMANGTAMSFGTIVRPSTASVIQLTSGGLRSVASGDAVLAGGSPTAAAFTINGLANQAINISAPAFNLTSGANSVTVTPSPSIANGATINGSGNLPFTVGGSLALGANQPTGSYTGTLSVTVSYP